MIGSLYQFIQRQVIHTVVFPVVGNLHLKRFVIRLVRKAGQHDIVVRADTQTFGKALRSIFLSFISKLFGQFSHINIEQTVH